MKKSIVVLLALCVSVAAVCAAGSKDDSEVEQAEKGNELVIYCPHPIEFINPIVSEFEAQTGVSVEVIAAGTGELLARVEAERDCPLGDVLWGSSPMTISDRRHLFEDYVSIHEDYFLDEFRNVGAFTRFTVMPSVILVNTNLVGDIEISNYEDLLNPEFKGKIAAVDPSISSSGWEHLVQMLYANGDGNPDKGWDYVEKFVEQLDGKLLTSSGTVHRGVADGEFAIGLTYEEPAAKYVVDGAPVDVIYMEDGVIFRADSTQIIKGARNLENAKAFIDFVSSKEIQQLIANELFRRSVRKDVPEARGLVPMTEIKIITDDVELTKRSKTTWCERFKELYIHSQG